MVKWLIVGLFVVIALLHLVWLDRIPVSLQPDELEFVLSGYTYRHYGVDVAGYGLPLSLFATQTHGVISPVPALVYALVFVFVEPTQWIVRLVPTLLMLGTSYFLYALCTLLFKRKDIGVIAALVFLIMPWQFHYSRYAADTPFALFFFVSGIYFLLRERVRYWWIGLGLLTLGFFSYHGGKLLFIPILVILLGYRWYEDVYVSQKLRMKNEKLKKMFIVFSTGLFIFLTYVVILFSLRDSIVAQRGEQLFFMSPKLEEEVNYLRQRALPSALNSVLINKLTVGGSIFVSNYLTSFSPDVLFVAGDTSTVNRWYVHGLLYPTDAVVLLIGLVWLWLKYRKQSVLIIGLIALSPLPSALSNFSASVIHRSFLLAGLFPILLACGYVGIWEGVKQYVKMKMVTIGIGVVVGGVIFIQSVNYFHTYFHRLMLLNPDSQFWGDRAIASYVYHFLSESTDGTLTILHGEPRAAALTALFYADPITRRNNLRPGNFPDLGNEFTIDRVTFRTGCDNDATGTILVHNDLQHCRNAASGFDAVLSPKDGGIYFRLYDDQLCRDTTLSGFTYPFSHRDFGYYPENRGLFCERWISTPVQL